MAQLISLSDQDLAELRAELDSGGAPTVWFTSAAVGVEPGASAKVVAFTEPAEGDFVQVRPTGSKDVLSFSPSELTRTRPPRKRSATKPAPRSRATTPKPAASVATPKAPPVGAAAPAVAVEPKRPAAAQPAVPKPAKRPVVKAAKTTEVTVTLSSNAAGDWTVEVLTGKKRTVRAAPVAPGDVAKAARSLPPAVGEAIDTALSAAREQQQARVEQLRAQLEEAQRALKDLG